MRRDAKSRGDKRPAPLAAFFPSVSALGAYMDALVDGGRCERDDDPPGYRKLLQTTMVGHGPLGGQIAFHEPAERLSDTVLKAITMMLKRDSVSARGSGGGGGGFAGKPTRNMLALGYDLRSDGGMNCVGSDSSLAHHFVNSSVVELGKGSWTRLLARTGTEAMSHLLCCTSMFLPLPNGGYRQLSGIPLASMQMPPAKRIGESTARAFRLPAAAGAKRKRGDVSSDTDTDMEDVEEKPADRRRRCRKAPRVLEPAAPSEQHHAGAGDAPLELASITIPRGRMLFSAPRLWGDLDWTLPPSFPLNRHTSGHLLAQHIFKRVPHFAAAPPAALLALTSRMLKLHKKFNYRHHLFRLCPAPWQQPQHGQQAPGDAQAPGPLDQASPHTAVFGFLQHCVRSVVPRDLVGGKRNHRRLYAALRTVVSAGRFEALSLHEVMQRFRLCEATKWLDTSAASAMDIYASMICWVLSEYTVRIVRKYFYVTESSQSRRHLYYFRSDVWRSLAREAWGQLKNSGIYAPKPESAAAAAAAAATDGHLAFGHSRMRLLPKEQGFRPIVNMRRSYMLRPVAPGAGSGTRLRLGERPAASTNKSLADILAALRPWQRGRPELFGTATFGPDDLHARLAAFKRSIGTAGGLGAVPLYMAKLDISRAYDTIPQTLLLSQLRACLPDGELAVQKYWTLSPSFSRPRPAFLRHGQRASDTAEFHDLARALAARHKGLVVGDQSATTYVHTDSIFARVSEHVQQTTVRAHGRLLRQARGIPQGSVLSSLLCNFFYGQLEAAHVAPILDPRTTLVMRVVDDILAVSTAEVQLVAVVECISRAFGERGSTLNPAKTLANFALAVGGQPARRTSGPGFPWCGMLIDDRSLDVMVDYSRMGPPLRVSSFLTVNPGREGGQLLRQKLLAAVRIKIHPLYMSCGFNSRGTVLLNLYQNFLICAKKLHAICQRLHACSLNQPFLASVIEDTLALAYILLRSRCRERSIAPDVVRWLGGHAFHAVLQRKKARYAVLLERLAPMRHAPPPAAATDAWVVQRRHNGAALDVIY